MKKTLLANSVQQPMHSSYFCINKSKKCFRIFKNIIDQVFFCTLKTDPRTGTRWWCSSGACPPRSWRCPWPPRSSPWPCPSPSTPWTSSPSLSPPKTPEKSWHVVNQNPRVWKCGIKMRVLLIPAVIALLLSSCHRDKTQVSKWIKLSKDYQCFVYPLNTCHYASFFISIENQIYLVNNFEQTRLLFKCSFEIQ